MVRKRQRFLRPCIDRLDDRCLLSGSGLPAGLSPVQLKTAYGINAVQFVANGLPYVGDGTGQTIAIVDAYHNPNVLSDLKKFDATFGLRDPQFTEINLGTADNVNDGWAGETALDVEWSHAIAPGANIVLVEAVDQTIPGLLAAIDVARHVPGVTAVSMSFGYAENQAPGSSAYDTYFTTPAGHTGITFIASSGDTGTLRMTGQNSGPSWPSTSPNVVAVGGTTLVLGGPKGYVGESIWNGSGGGYSLYVPEPAYQRSIQSTGKRSVPDVALVADPYTGVAVYTTYPQAGFGGWGVVGGTSLSSPAWAGIMAIINQGRDLQHLASLDGPTETLPDLYALPASDFNKIALSGPGYGQSYSFGSQNQSKTMIQTGLGSPAGMALINDLITPPAPKVVVTPPTGTVVTTTSAFGAGFGLVVGPGVGSGSGTGSKPTKHPKPPHKPHVPPKPKPKPHPKKTVSHSKFSAQNATPAIVMESFTPTASESNAAVDAAIGSFDS